MRYISVSLVNKRFCSETTQTSKCYGEVYIIAPEFRNWELAFQLKSVHKF